MTIFSILLQNDGNVYILHGSIVSVFALLFWGGFLLLLLPKSILVAFVKCLRVHGNLKNHPKL